MPETLELSIDMFVRPLYTSTVDVLSVSTTSLCRLSVSMFAGLPNTPLF